MPQRRENGSRDKRMKKQMKKLGDTDEIYCRPGNLTSEGLKGAREEKKTIIELQSQ